MPRQNMNDVIAFLAVAKQRSFTRAAARLGVSQSALSHTIRGLEARLGLRLLARTTRSVAPTAAGERLLQAVGPRLDEIEHALADLSELRDKPAGTIRITIGEHAAETIVWPALAKLLPRYPDIKVELVIDYGLTDIVAEGYDAGVRLGEQVARDMIAARIGPDLRMAVVGAPSYFAKHDTPKKPQDLTAHACINLRLPTHGGLYAVASRHRPSRCWSIRCAIESVHDQQVPATTTRFRPSDLARYSAASAALIMASRSSRSFSVATPRLAVTARTPGPASIPVAAIS
jgi:DNA-binding transcriptional LysR family regulator